ncbi:MAG: DUF2079 domain-containing protein [Candidatus Eremiobacteraeota bacterium]|nr:DUF2079 domain-containing protein [Candidatus Eremiobacteraeota bacterium]
MTSSPASAPNISMCHPERSEAQSKERALYIAVAVFIVVYVAYDLNRLYALRYGADLGTYLQTLVNLRGGSSWNYGEWRPHFQVHDSWVLIALVPLIALIPRAETLIVVQVAAVALAAIPLALFAREIGVAPRAATIVAIAYLLTPSAQGIAYDNFSENVFVPLLVFSGALAVRKRALLPALVLGALLLGLKEDEIFFVAWFAAACALWWDRRIGSALLALCVLNGVAYWAIESLHGVRPNDPPYGLAVHDVSGKFTLVSLLLAPFAFAPLAVGRWLLLSVPLLAEIVFMQPWTYEPSRIGSHYTAPLLAAAAIAAAFGLRRFPAFARAMIPCALVATFVIFTDTALRPGRWPYIVDWPAYARAVAIRNSTSAITLPRRDEGVWAVAAVNPRVRLDPHPDPLFVACPAYNTDARAFFASLAGTMPAALCGGVPVRIK